MLHDLPFLNVNLFFLVTLKVFNYSSFICFKLSNLSDSCVKFICYFVFLLV